MTQRRVKIFGPPGTGKTDYLLRYVAASRRPPERVGFVTFTRAAREEALGRLGGGEAAWPLVKTLHSLCYRGLGMSSGRMVGRDDLQRFAKLVGVEVGGDVQLDEEAQLQELPLGDRLLRVNHLGRHRKQGLRAALASLHVDCDEQLAVHFTKSYSRWKEEEGLLDFTDLLTRYLLRGTALPVDLFIVDEAQDLSPLQWDVVEKLGQRAEELLVAGDDDQAIYSWAGATADLLNDWPADETLVLDQSYRLPAAVHAKVVELGSRIERRTPKAFRPRVDEEGAVEYVTQLVTVASSDDALLLYRYGHRGKQLARQLREQRACFGGVLSPLHPKQLRSALRFLAGDRSTETRQAAVSLTKRQTEPTKVEDLTLAWYHDYVVEVVREQGIERALSPTVQLLSIHQSKGRQAENVLLDTSLSRASYEHLLADPDDEHRCWYVGASRARKLLVVLESGASRYRYEI